MAVTKEIAPESCKSFQKLADGFLDKLKAHKELEGVDLQQRTQYIGTTRIDTIKIGNELYEIRNNGVEVSGGFKGHIGI